MDEIRTIENYLGVHPDTELKEVLQARLEKLRADKPKLKLKTIQVTATLIDSDDFNEFVEDKYGGSFEIIAIEELNNNTRWSFSLPSMTKLTKDREDKIRNGDYPMYSTQEVIQCLYFDGHIEDGDYEIAVNW